MDGETIQSAMIKFKISEIEEKISMCSISSKGYA